MQQKSHFQMPFVLAGEIIETKTADDGTLEPVKDMGEKADTGTDRAVGYTVLVEFPNGSRTAFSDVQMACLFGGIGDFFQARLRASGDPSGKYELPKDEADAASQDSSIGARVIVAFLGGDLRRPIIVGFLSHPQRAFDIPDKTKKDTQAKLAFKGLEIVVDDIGQTKILTRGAPSEVDIITGDQMEPLERTDSEPITLPDRETIAPLPSAALTPVMPKTINMTATLDTPTENEALVYPDPKYTTEMGFLQLGEWYVVDSEGQTVMLDRDSQTITITNGADTIQIDKQHKKIFLQSSGDMETTIENDYATSVTGNKHQTISKNEWYAVKGDEYRTVGGKRTSNIVDKDTSKVGSSWSVEVGSADTVEGGTGTSADKHNASIKISSGNSFTMDDDNIYLVHKAGAVVTIDKKGNISMLAKDGSNLYLNADKATATLQSSGGALIALDDKITCIDKTGAQMIVVKDGVIDITSSGQVTLTAATVSLNGGTIALGNQANMSAVLGENLQSWLDAHTHPTGAGPSGPPLIPSATYTKTPMDILSAAVKVRSGGL